MSITIKGEGVIRGKQAIEIAKRGIEVNGKIYKLVAIEDLSVDQNYQRPLKKTTVNKIINSFDPMALSVFQIAQRYENGKKYIIDAQHQHVALMLMKDDGELPPEFNDGVMCAIQENTTPRKEAEMFVKMNTNKPVTGNDKFRAAMRYHGQPEWIISQWVKQEGFELDFLAPGRPTTADLNSNGIRGVNMLLTCYNKCYNYLQHALTFLKIMYNKTDCVPYDLRQGPVVFGIALYLLRFKISNPKGLKQLAATIRMHELDISTAWHDCKQLPAEQCFQKDYSKHLALWFETNCNAIVKMPVRRNKAA